MCYEIENNATVLPGCCYQSITFPIFSILWGKNVLLNKESNFRLGENYLFPIPLKILNVIDRFYIYMEIAELERWRFFVRFNTISKDSTISISQHFSAINFPTYHSSNEVWIIPLFNRIVVYKSCNFFRDYLNGFEV